MARAIIDRDSVANSAVTVCPGSEIRSRADMDDRARGFVAAGLLVLCACLDDFALGAATAPRRC